MRWMGISNWMGTSALFLACGVWLTGCLNSDPSGSKMVDDTAGPAIHDIKTGQPFLFSAHKGHWMLINYWASWCDHCVGEIPVFNAFQQAHPDVQIVGVNIEKLDGPSLQKAIEENHIAYTHLDADPRDKLGINPPDGVPVTWVVDPDGRVRLSPLQGPQSREQLEAALR